MAYHITKEFSNGYRCGCCSHSWDSEEWVDTLEEALLQVPTELVDGEPHAFNGDFEIVKVEVKNGATGENEAWGSAHWSQGYGRGSGYDYTHWTGYRPDTGGFDVVYSGRTKVTDRTWDECIGELREKNRARELAKAERELADAQKRVEHYTSTAESAT